MIKVSENKAFIEYEFINPRDEKLGLYRIPLGKFMDIVSKTENLAELRLAIIENAERDIKGSEEEEIREKEQKVRSKKARFGNIT